MARKKDNEKKGELVYGFHAIHELLNAKRRRLTVIYTTNPHPKTWQHISALLPRGMQVQYVSKQILDRLAGTTDHQSLVAFAQPFEIRKQFFDAKKHPFLLLLDSIQDPRNVGAILRSAYCTGVSGVILCAKGGSPLTATALKSSAGLAEHMQIFIASTVQHAVQLLKQEGYHLYLSVISTRAVPAQSVTYTQPLCLVIGNEAKGISRDILKSGTHIMLAQQTSDISYNASVAAGILLFIIGTQTKTI